MRSGNDIAVVGMACVFPQAPDLKRYWSNLVNGVDAIAAAPASRWRDHANFGLPPDHEAHIPCRRGGFLAPETFFDPAPFGIPPNLVRHGDPDQFLMLHLIDQALRDARVADDHPVREQTDVIIGRGGYPTGKLIELSMRAELLEIFLQLTERKFPELTAAGRREALEEYWRSTLTRKAVDNVSTAIPNIIASRCANRLNLRGAAYVVDAACASSLLAVEQALGRLRSRQCDLAIAAGLFMTLSVTFLYVFSELNALSPSQMIRPFDRRADGLLPGEGGGAVVLKRLEDAVRDGDAIYAIVKGAGSASDGKAVDVLAPSSGGQVKALERAYADAGVDRDRIGYLEVHGTGTVVGDLAEIATIKRFFGTSKLPPTARAMGSVKSMIGHAMPAAGIASFIKTALMLSNKLIPPSLHCEEPRPELLDAPFYLNPRTRPWIHDPARGPRRAGINAFGFGGINAHVILEEVPAAGPTRHGRPSHTGGLTEANGHVMSGSVEHLPSSPGGATVISQGHQPLEGDQEPSLLAPEGRQGATEVPAAPPGLGSGGLSVQGLTPLANDRRPAGANTQEDFATATGTVRPRPLETGLHRPSELLVFAAASAPELLQQLRRLERFLDQDQSGATLADISWSLAHEVNWAHPVKLALICDDFAHLRRLLGQCPAAFRPASERDVVEEIYFADRAAHHDGKVAVILPGMGFPGLIGNYPDHLLELCMHYPAMRQEMDFFEDRDRHPDDTVPTSAVFCPPATLPEEFRQQLKARLAPPKADAEPDTQALPHERYLAGMGITLSNWACWVLLRQLQIPVDMLTGQSQGEMAALCAAGVSDFHEVAPHFWKVLDVDFRDLNGGRLAFAWVPAEIVEPLLAEQPGTYLAIHMAQHAVVFGGAKEPLLRVAERLRQDNHLVQLLPYPPIHTPLLSHLRGELVAQLGGQDMRAGKPQIDLYSSITSEKYPEDEPGIRETLLLNVDRPLRIWQTIARMYADGARIFVQLGGGHMAAHLEVMLPEGSPVVTAALDVDSRNPITQLNHMCARLFTAGVPFHLEPLFEHRPVRERNLDAPGPAPAQPRLAVPLRIDWTPTYNENVPPKRPEVRPPAPEPPAAEQPALPDVTVDARLPVLGKVLALLPGREVVIERTLDLAEDLYLQDHLFVHAECKPLEERLPVLPLTMSMELSAEAASLLCPGLTLIGFENVRGLHWIGLREQSSCPLRIEARLHANDPETGVARTRVTVIFDDRPSFTAVVLFAPAYRQDVHLQLADSSADGPWPFSAEEVYSERLMFHGPRFFCIHRLDTLGNPGASAALRLLPNDSLFASRPAPRMLTDPTLMDGIGQFIGLWCIAHEQCILPVSVEKIEFYRPTPAPGTVVPVRMETVEFNQEARKIRCNAEIEDGEGFAWVRIVGWTEWVMNWSQKYVVSTRRPDRYLLAEELALPGLSEGGVCTLLTRNDFKHVTLEWVARIFLHSRELPEFFALTAKLRQQQRLVCSRSAVKEAARLWWARQYGTALPHPAEFAVGHDDLGRPFLEPAGEPSLPQISVASSGEYYVALAAGVPVGIDIEPVDRDTRAILTQFAAAEEISLVDQLAAAQPDEVWETRLWCAKEAAAKALGTGLQGRPKAFRALDADAAGSWLIHHLPTGERFVVHTVRVDPLVVAYTAVTSPVRRVAEPEVLDIPSGLEVR